MKYIKEFADNAAYTAYTSSADFVTPNVSYIVEDNAVEMTPYVPPVIEPKWIATYSDSHVESASCDSTSAISDYEITLADLVDVQIGQCVTSIGDYAFEFCDSLTSVTIGSGVTSIGNNAFGDCTSLTSIDIPNSVISIGNGVFNGCSNLTSVTVNATTPPNLSSMAFFNTPIDYGSGYIYVPAESVTDYRIQWGDYTNRIQPIPNS